MEVEDLENVPLTPEQVAAALQVPERTIYFWLDKEWLPAVQEINRRWTITVGNVRQFIRSRKVRDSGRTELRFNQWIDENILGKSA